MSLSKQEFYDEVANCYRHLYDLIFLRTRPLTDILIPDPSVSKREKGWQLHHLLLDVIAELNPGANAPMNSREWRRHQIMVLRFIDQLEPEAIANELGISRRQFFREQREALETIADILRNRYVESAMQTKEPVRTVEEPVPIERMELLRLETARLGRVNRYSRVADVVQGVLPLLADILHQQNLTVKQDIPEMLPVVSIDQNVLRQMMLGILGYFSACSENATIRISATNKKRAICLSASVDPPSAVQRAPIESEERLSTLEEMAGLSDAQVSSVVLDGTIIGFDIHLTAIERTILVADDNEDLLELFKRYLTPLNYRVITATTGQKALELARRFQPGVITLDLMMPDQDGWDVLQSLLNQPDTQQIPVIVCSVLKEKNLALSLGATAFLEKPITRQMLHSALKALEES